MRMDWPLAELERYTPPLTAPPDLSAWWEEAVTEARSVPLQVTLEPRSYPVEQVRVFRCRFAGADGSRLAAWYLVPVPSLRKGKRAPGIVVFHGYAGSAGTVADHLAWVLQGYPVLAVDVRGQNGESEDRAAYPEGSYPGWMTRGITDPRRYYYRYVYQDAVRAVDVMAEMEEVDADRIAVRGASQGGGLSIAAAALHPRVALAMPDVPYLCHMERALEVFTEGPYQEIVGYLRRYPDRVQQVMTTLSYVDGMNLAPRVRCPVLMSVGLLDPICPPSTGFATYHHLGSQTKELKVYPFNGHEGGGSVHAEVQFVFLRRHLE